MTAIPVCRLHGQTLEGVLAPLLEKSFACRGKAMAAHLVADHYKNVFAPAQAR